LLCVNTAAVPLNVAEIVLTLVYCAVTPLVILGATVLKLPLGVYVVEVEVGVVSIVWLCDRSTPLCVNVAALP